MSYAVSAFAPSKNRTFDPLRNIDVLFTSIVETSRNDKSAYMACSDDLRQKTHKITPTFNSIERASLLRRSPAAARTMPFTFFPACDRVAGRYNGFVSPASTSLLYLNNLGNDP